MFAFVGEEVPQVCNLEEEECEPIEGGNEGIQSEGCGVCSVLSPNGISPFHLVILWFTIGIVDAGDDSEEPC